MPGRKSTESSAVAARSSNGKEDESMVQTVKGSQGLSVEELNLPKSMVQRLAKGVLPPNTQIQKDALLAISKSATVFVNYLASAANDRTVMANKKTIQPKDVFEALGELEFEDFRPRCEAELERYNNIQCDKRNNYRRRVKEERATDAANDAALQADAAAGESTFAGSLEGGSPHKNLVLLTNGHSKDLDRDEAPATKRPRISLGSDDEHVGDDGDETIDEDEDEEDEEFAGDEDLDSIVDDAEVQSDEDLPEDEPDDGYGDDNNHRVAAEDIDDEDEGTGSD